MKLKSAILSAILVTALPCAFAEDFTESVPLIDAPGGFATAALSRMLKKAWIPSGFIDDQPKFIARKPA